MLEPVNEKVAFDNQGAIEKWLRHLELSKELAELLVFLKFQFRHDPFMLLTRFSISGNWHHMMFWFLI